MGAAKPSETSVLFYHTAWRVIQKTAATIISALGTANTSLCVTVMLIGLLPELDIENCNILYGYLEVLTVVP
jgi:hypothetical protein